MKPHSPRQAKVCAWAHAYVHQSAPWVVVDTETTGLSAQQDEVIELAIVDASGTPLLSSLIQTQDPARADLATHIHGITSQQLAVALTDARSALGVLRALAARHQPEVREQA